MLFNTYHAAGVIRRQVQNCVKCSKNVEILEFGNNIWNHREKCIQISTHMPSIGSIINEKGFDLKKKMKKKTLLFAWESQYPRC